MLIYTIGHSTRPFGEFLSLSKAHGINGLADVRTIPQSRRHPQFGREVLSASLKAAGIEYRHFPGLGGLRKPRLDSANTGWKNESFRGYADYLDTPAFRRALEDLLGWISDAERPLTAAVMCAEAIWWRCHRQLIADALVARGILVAHVMGTGQPAAHALTAFARVTGLQVHYPSLL